MYSRWAAAQPRGRRVGSRDAVEVVKYVQS
jgi:hypothetical protein